MRKGFTATAILALACLGGVSDAKTKLQPIQKEFVEDFGGPLPGLRYKVRHVSIMGKGNVVHVRKGGAYPVTMDVLHDCGSCGNAVNQVLVGLGGEKMAQDSVWNGKKRSGGGLRVVNLGTDKAGPCEDNPGEAQWVKVSFSITVPDKPGAYYIRTRYAQDYQGNLRTAEGLEIDQPRYETVLGWWTVDRPEGPDGKANIGAIVVE